jgi:hypothetical protein
MTTDTARHESGTQPKAKVFISYSRKDMAFADRLETALKARGFEPLIDRTEIYAFEEWWTRIEALITRADTVVFVLSPDAVASDVARREVTFAASLNKRFAPIAWRRVDDKDVPEALAKLNFIFFDDQARFEQSADRLAEALNTDISWIRQHTKFGEQARRWSQAKSAQNEAQAKAERDNATRNFRLAQKTAESLVYDIARGLQNVLGMPSETVRKILDTAKTTFEQLASAAADDLDLQSSRSVMLEEFGNTYLTLGDLEHAFQAYRDGLTIRERLAGADRSNTQWQRDLSVSYTKVGDVLVAQGKLDEALTA